MSAFYTVSTVSVRGGLRARPAVLPDTNQVLMSLLYTVSTLSMRGGLWVSSVHTLHVPKPVDNVCVRSAKCYAKYCFGTYCTHAQTSCDSKCYAKDCFGSYFYTYTCPNL